MAAPVSMANPTGGQVVSGAATITTSGNTVTVNQATQRAIVNWQGFSIAPSEVTRFVQPSASSAILNRVVSGNPSALLGRLEANGQVFLINPNGILVGGGAVINTNGFVASTRDLPNAQFMAGGDMKFVGDGQAGVRNLGTIRAEGGDVFLIGHTVSNAGTIEAPRGTVGLAAGTEVLLKHAADERLFIQKAIGSAAGSEKGIDNSGIITAVQAELRAAGGNVYSLAINNTGAIHASGIAEKDGRVYLTGGSVQSTGTIAARDADGTGGTVVVTGERVTLTGGARVDVSGERGGGIALIGGDYRGENPAVENAQTTRVGGSVVIAADANAQGDGGKVVVWADDSTDFRGTITARGGANGGAGGFAEVSGKQSLGFTGRVDLSAPRGAIGTLLLDPQNARLRTGGTATPGEVDDFSDAPDQERVIDPVALAATNADVFVRANNDIFVDSPVQLVAPGAGFSAFAGRNISIDNVPISTNNGAIFLNANNAGADQAFRESGAGVIVMQTGATIASGNANVTLRLDPTPDALNTSQFITVGTINAGTGTITLTNTGAAANPANGTIAQVGNGLTAARLIVEAPGQVLLQSLTNNVGQLLLDTQRQLLFNNAGALIVGGTGPTTGFGVGAGDVTIRALTGDLTNNAPGLPTAGGGGGIVTFDAAAGSLRMNDAPRAAAGSPFAPSVVNVALTAANNVRVLAPNLRARNLTVTATNGAISFETPAGASNFGVVAQDISPGGVVTMSAGTNISSTATSPITARSLSLTANAGTIDLHGVVNATTLNASAPGNIVVDHPSANAILQLGAISSGADITIKNFPAFAWNVVGLTRSTAAAGRIAITTNTNVQFLPSANCRIETGANGTIVFDAGAGQVLDGTTPSFIGGNLLISARAIGGGTTNPLDTQVSRLSARATRSNNFGGFAFFNNNANAAGAISLGGVDGSIFGITGDGPSGSQCIQLVNNGSILLDQGGIFASNTNTNAGGIVINATGSSSDFITSAGPFFGIAVLADGALNVTSGRDIVLGAGTGTGAVAARGAINASAGRNVMLQGPQLLGAASENVAVTAAGTIQVGSGGGSASAVRSAAAGRVTLTGSTIDLNNGSVTDPAMRTNETGSGGSIALTGDTINIASRIDGGSGPVSIGPRTSNRPISIGTETAGSLSLTDAELDRVNASILSLGAFATTGTMTINQPLTRPSNAPTYNSLELLNSGAIRFDSSVDTAGAPLVAQALGGNLEGGGAITASTASLFTSTGSIALSGNITAQTLTVNAPGGGITLSGPVRAGSLNLNAPTGDVLLRNDRNEIDILTGANFNQEFRLLDRTGGLAISGFVDGGAIAFGLIETRGGNLVLQQGAKIFFGGANQTFRLFSDTGFVNLAGATALVPENGGRWVLFSPSPEVTQLGGLTAPFTFFGLTYPETPTTNGNTLVYASAQPGAGGTTPSDVPPLPDVRLFRVDPQTPEVAELLGRFEKLTKLKFDDTVTSVKIAPNAEQIGSMISGDEQTAMDLAGDFFNFRDRQYDDAVKKLRALNLPAGERDKVEVLIAMVEAGMAETDHKYIEFLTQQSDFGGFRNEARKVLENLRQLEALYLDVSGQRAIQDLIADAERFASNGNIVAGRNGTPIVIPGGDFRNGGPQLSNQQILMMSLQSGGLTFSEVNRIVAAGGGNLNPGVIAALVAAGGGNMSATQINSMVAAGGGNLRNPVTLNAVVNATLVAAGAGNLVAAGGLNLVAAGAGNLVAAGGGNLVAAGGGNLVAAGGLNLVAAGGLNLLDPQSVQLVAAGGGNLVAAGGGNLVAAGGGNLVAAGGLNLTSQVISSLVAAGAGNLVAAGGGNLVAAGGGNLTPADVSHIITSGLVAAGAGNLVAAGGLNLVAAGGGNLVAAGGGNLVAAGGLNLVAAGGGNLVAAGGLNFTSISAGLVAAGAGSGIL